MLNPMLGQKIMKGGGKTFRAFSPLFNLERIEDQKLIVSLESVHSLETKLLSAILFVILFFILLLFSEVLEIMILKISLAEPQGMLRICLIFLEI